MRRWRKPARGYAHRSDAVKRIAISFDDETFQDVRALAIKGGVSFAEQNRQLVEWGLEAVRSGERNVARAQDR